MARLSYQAPGVYVEEVPSAQQPIAGVGTNTVGFIGIVPDEISYPVPNPEYDPVIARDVLALTKGTLSVTEKTEDLAKIDQLIDKKQGLLSKATDDQNDINSNLKETLQPALDKANADLQKATAELEQWSAGDGDDEKSRREKQVVDCQRAVDAATKPITKALKRIEALDLEIQQLKDEIKELTDAKTTGKVQSPTEITRGSVLSPYLLKKFGKAEGMVDCCETKLCTNFTEYTNRFGPFSADGDLDPKDNTYKAKYPGHRNLTHAVNGFFKNGGTRCFVARVDADPNNPMAPKNPSDVARALKKFESIEELAIIAAPGLDASQDVWSQLVSHCEQCENRFAILDCPAAVEDEQHDLDVGQLSYDNLDNLLPQRNKNAAFYFPYIEVVDPAKQMQDADPFRGLDPKYWGRLHVPPSGHIAGIYARTDEERGVHKAPANSAVLGALNVKYYISKPKQELLNPQGVNCIRNINGNITVWGARTIGGDKNSEWKYVNVRRVFLFLRKSIDEGTQWVVFEPNDRALWGKICRNVSDFLRNVWRSGALFGSTPEEAFYVKCDDETNPPEVRELGQVITEIGVAIVRPAEFVIFRVTQSTGARK